MKFRKILIGLLLPILILGCVERVKFDAPPADYLTVVEGYISDQPGPYTVTVSKGMDLDIDSLVKEPITGLTIKLFDDEGNEENFIEVKPGEYSTGGVIRGQVGHTYNIQIETSDGKVFESEPEIIQPVGEVETISFEYEPGIAEEEYGDVRADVFNIYIDADAGIVQEPFVRWRFTGIYKVQTYPELHTTWVPPYTPYKDPLPCSGYIVDEGIPGGILVQVGDCSCCTCWVKDYEMAPQLSDAQLVSNSQFKHVKVGEVPITNTRLYEKYLLVVDQMSLSRTSFEFFKLIRDQKENAADLFQPPAGELKGNIHAINTNDPVVGIFWATSIKSRSRFINSSDVPFNLTPISTIKEDCREYYEHSSTQIPDQWN